MAGYREEVYEAVDKQFETMTAAKDHFADLPLEDPTPYEQPFNPIQPAQWVENSDPDLSGGASVSIDSDGITILNGKIFLSDPGGDSVLGPAGFSGSWIDFLADRFYNSKFAFGTTGALPDSVIGGVGTAGAGNAQDYADSISFDLPYWLIDILSGTGAPELITDTTATGGRAYWVDDDIEAVIFQDVPVSPGRNYSVMMSWKWKGASDNVTRTISLSWRDSTHAIIGSEIETGLVFSTDQTTYHTEVVSNGLSIAPANAAYLRVGITLDTTSGATAEATINHVRLTEATLEGLDTLSFGSGSATFFVNSSGVLEADVKIEAPSLRANNTDDASLSSTGHGLQVGPTTGANLIADPNEIMARNNGSAADLHLNADGGDVTVGFNTSAVVRLTNAGNIQLTHGFITMNDYTSLPGAADTDTLRLFADKSGGKMRLRVRWPSGTSTIATEP